MSVEDSDFEDLLRLRTGLRRFIRRSERQAQAAGLTAVQHELLLAIRGHPGPLGPTIGEVADYLVLRHHSAVGLIDRAEAADLVRRTGDPDNHSVVRVTLTPTGAEKLAALTEIHLEELARLAPMRQVLLGALEQFAPADPAAQL